MKPFLCVVLSLCLVACVASQAPLASLKPDFSQFVDSPIATTDAIWLRQGKQTVLSEAIASEGLSGINRREVLYKVIDHLWSKFAYNAHLNSKMPSRDAIELFNTRQLGGCIDYAIASAVLLRANKVPTRIVVTIHAPWIQVYHFNPLSIPHGHTFLEVYLEDRWFLVDPVNRILYLNYDMESIFYPRDEILCAKGIDLWSIGIKTMQELHGLLKSCAAKLKSVSYKAPQYEHTKL